jgi:DNA-binding LacI/PurR family transcriptional regulator
VVCLGAKAAVAEFGLSVPDDLSLVGYDNSPLARLRSIWLTSVDSGGAEVGRLAARTLAARIDAPAAPAQVHLLAPTLQVRGSTGPPC